MRRWLAHQTSGEVGAIALDTVLAGTDALRKASRAARDAGRRVVVTDAIADEDRLTIGAAAADHKLITGGSGIAQGLPQKFRAKGRLGARPESVPTVEGPGIALCGSCSATSQQQVATFAQVIRPTPWMQARSCGAVIHLPSTYETALSCLADIDPNDALPPTTPLS